MSFSFVLQPFRVLSSSLWWNGEPRRIQIEINVDFDNYSSVESGFLCYVDVCLFVVLVIISKSIDLNRFVVVGFRYALVHLHMPEVFYLNKNWRY